MTPTEAESAINQALSSVYFQGPEELVNEHELDKDTEDSKSEASLNPQPATPPPLQHQPPLPHQAQPSVTHPLPPPPPSHPPTQHQSCRALLPPPHSSLPPTDITITARKSSVDSLEMALRNVDFRRCGVVLHPHNSIRIVIVSARGLKLGDETLHAVSSSTTLLRRSPISQRLGVRVGLLRPSHLSQESVITSIQPVQIHQSTKKGRKSKRYAFIPWNEECRFPFSNERQIL